MTQTHIASPDPTLPSFLSHKRAALTYAWAELLRRIPDSRYRTVRLEQLQSWIAGWLDALGDVLASGSFDALDMRLIPAALAQVRCGLTIDEVLDGLLLGKKAMMPLIWEQAGDDTALIQHRAAELDTCMQYAAGRLAAQFAASSTAQLREHERRTSLMLDAAQTAGSSLDLEEVLARIATSMAAAVAARDCAIYLLDTARNTLVLRATTHAETGVTASDAFSLDAAVDPLLGAVLTRHVPVVFPEDAEAGRAGQAGTVMFERTQLLALPICAPGDRLLGVAIVVGADAERRFTDAQVALAWGIARAVALAVDNAQLYAGVHARLAESESFERISSALLRNLALDDVLEIVCGEAMHLTGARGSLVALLEDDGTLRVARCVGDASPPIDRLPVEASLTGQAMRQRAPLLANNTTALLAAPLVVADAAIGAINLVDKADGFTPEDLRIVGLLADQAAIAIHNARLHEQVAQLAAVAERQRLAHDLHDSVAQSLYSLTLYVEATTGAVRDGENDTAIGHLREMEHIAQDALHEMRLLLFNLHPPILEQEGLVAAVQARLDAVEARAAIRTELAFEGEEQLPFPTKEALYFVAQEALNNTLRHAEAHHVAVHLVFGDTTMRMEIADDGRGFDLDAATNKRGLGLHGMQERVQQLGGQLAIRSIPGAGTSIVVEIGR